MLVGFGARVNFIIEHFIIEQTRGLTQRAAKLSSRIIQRFADLGVSETDAGW